MRIHRSPSPSKRRRLGAAVLAAVAAGALLPATGLAARTHEFTVVAGAATGMPKGITTGPDGNLWVALSIGHGVGRLTPQGVFSRFNVGFVDNADPQYIVVGPDRAMWFTDQFALGDPSRPSAGVIHRVTTTGAVTDYPLPTVGGSEGIASGPDGALWYTQGGSSLVGRLATDGGVREFPLPGAALRPGRITTGSDGALWFVQEATGTVGRLAPDGSYRSFSPPSPSAEPPGVHPGITAGPDGAIWFVEYTKDRVARIAPDGTISEFPLPAGESQPGDIITGPDGALWLTEGYNGHILRLTVGGQYSAYRLPGGGVSDLTVGPDGIWYTRFGGQVGRLDTLDPPIVGKTVAAEPVSGKVRVKTPGQKGFVPLGADGGTIPMGTEVDTGAGRVRLTAAAGTGSPVTKTAEFYGGRFTISQAAATDAVLDLKLSGPTGCTTGHLGANLPPGKAKGSGRGRAVWGDGKGTFRTTGNRSAATVRGTIWQVQDRCDRSTITRVRRGVVSVRDFARRRTVSVKAGHSYVARPKQR